MTRTATAVAAVLALLAGPVLAQSTTPPQEADPVAALLGSPAPAPAAAPSPTAPTAATIEARGETNGPAPDAAQNPVEVTITQRLNAEVAARDEMAAQTDRANQAAHAADVAEYKEAVADTEAERERIAIDAQINAQSRAEYDADQESRYQKALADWRATVAACERGNTPRCRAGSMPARPGS